MRISDWSSDVCSSDLTCLREAGAARDESRRHRLINGNESYQQNQTSRCQALPVAERGDCMLQMSGQDTKVEGSVGAGGVLRETTITIPGTPTPAPGAAPVTPAPGLTRSEARRGGHEWVLTCRSRWAP